MDYPDFAKGFYQYSEAGFSFSQVNNSAYGIRFGHCPKPKALNSTGAILPLSGEFLLKNNSHPVLTQWHQRDSGLESSSDQADFIELYHKEKAADSLPDLSDSKAKLKKKISGFDYESGDCSYFDIDLKTQEINLISIDPDTAISGHTHPVPVVILVTEGTYHLTIDLQEVSYTPGEYIFIPSGVWHTVRSKEAVKAIEFWDGIDFWED